MSEDSAKRLIIENRTNSFGEVKESKIKPDNPLVIIGTAVTVGSVPEIPDVKERLIRLSEEGDKFMVGAADGYALGNEVFNNNQNDLARVAMAYLDAETRLVDKTPFGRSLWLIKVEAMRNMDAFYDKQNERYPLNNSYYKRKQKFLDKAYKKWCPTGDPDNKPPVENFIELTHKLISIRAIINGKQIPIQKNDLVDSSKTKVEDNYHDGFTKAFNYTAEEEQLNPDFKNKFWYLKEN